MSPSKKPWEIEVSSWTVTHPFDQLTHNETWRCVKGTFGTSFYHGINALRWLWFQVPTGCNHLLQFERRLSLLVASTSSVSWKRRGRASRTKNKKTRRRLDDDSDVRFISREEKFIRSTLRIVIVVTVMPRQTFVLQECGIAQEPSNRKESECLLCQKKPDSSRHRYELQSRVQFKFQCAKQRIGPLVLREDHRCWKLA